MKTKEKITIVSMLLGPGVAYGSFYLYHAVLFFKAGLAVISLASRRSYMLPVIKHTGPIYLFMMLTVLSILYSFNAYLSLIHLYYLIIGLSIVTQIASYCSNVDRLRSVYMLMAVVVVFITLIGLAELFTGFRWPSSPYSSLAPYFGRELKDLSHLSDVQIVIVNAMPASVYINPNNFSVFLVIILPFAFFMHKNIFSRVFIVLSVVLILSVGSRSCVIAIFVLCLVTILFYRLQYALFGMLLFILFLYLLPLLTEIPILETGLKRISQIFYALVRYITIEQDRSDSVSTRATYVKYGLMALKDSYYLGVGAGSSGLILELRNPGSGQISVHNFLLEIFIDYGFVGITLFLTSYIYCIIFCYRCSKRKLDPFLRSFNSALFTSLIAFIPASIALSSAMFYFPMWILLGLTIATIKLNRKGVSGGKPE